MQRRAPCVDPNRRSFVREVTDNQSMGPRKDEIEPSIFYGVTYLATALTYTEPSDSPLFVFTHAFFRQRKESALLDLEESYHTEFGSVDLRYRSPLRGFCVFYACRIVIFSLHLCLEARKIAWVFYTTFAHLGILPASSRLGMRISQCSRH